MCLGRRRDDLAEERGHAARTAAYRAKWRGQAGLIGDDDSPVLSCRCQNGYVPRIARQDAIARRGQQRNGRIDRIRGADRGLKNARLAPVPLADCAHIDSPQQPSQIHLATMPVAPDLSDDHRIGPQLQAMLLGRLEAGDHRPVITVNGHQGSGIKDHRAHAA